MIYNVPPYMKKPYGAYVKRLITKQMGPAPPKFASPIVKELLDLCLKFQASERSTAAELIEFLRGVYTPPGMHKMCFIF